MLVPPFDQYEVLLCVQDHDDPAIDVCKKLLGKYPNVDARLFIGKYQSSCQPFCFGSFKCQQSSLQWTLDQALSKGRQHACCKRGSSGEGKDNSVNSREVMGGESWLPNDIQIISYPIIRYEYLLPCFGFFFAEIFFSFFLFWLVPQPSIYPVSGSWPFQQCWTGFHLMEQTLIRIRSIRNQLLSHFCASLVPACVTGRCAERLPVP